MVSHMASTFDIDAVREQFPALQKRVGDHRAIYFDGPAGSQVPQRVADAVHDYLLETNANHEGTFATSQESDRILELTHAAVADFLGAPDADCVSFGANMTSLTFALSRALAKTWRAGDEIIVSRLDHDANVTPWVLAAKDVGVKVNHLEFQTPDCTLDLEQYAALLNEKTRLVAVGFASNVTGTINPVEEMTQQAHSVGAEFFIDAVHYAPHGLIDVQQIDCDYLICSAYKFFGPHIGVMYGKRSRMEKLQPYKLRPAPDSLPGRWMTGTQNHECIAGTLAAIDYLSDLGSHLEPQASDRRTSIEAAFRGITDYENKLSAYFLKQIAEFKGITVWGMTNPQQLHERTPTFSMTDSSKTPMEIAKDLAREGIFSWAGNHYALPFTTAAGLEPEGVLRVGFLHYNTTAEIDRLIDVLRTILC